MNSEPVIIINSVIGAIEAGLAVLIAFGVFDWTAEQTGLVLAFVITLGTIAQTVWARSRVMPSVG